MCDLRKRVGRAQRPYRTSAATIAADCPACRMPTGTRTAAIPSPSFRHRYAAQRPLRDWMFAINSVMTARKGNSATQLPTELDVPHRMAHVPWNPLSVRARRFQADNGCRGRQCVRGGTWQGLVKRVANRTALKTGYFPWTVPNDDHHGLTKPAKTNPIPNPAAGGPNRLN